jgi:hypothetical protein
MSQLILFFFILYFFMGSAIVNTRPQLVRRARFSLTAQRVSVRVRYKQEG